MDEISSKLRKLNRSGIRKIVDDPVKTAKAIDLVYVTDCIPGIKRNKIKDSFVYRSGDTIIKDEPELQRIKKLVIPPAWENVWICRLHNGHLQATGIDAKKRKQYRYHTSWSILRNHTKFYRMLKFGKLLPVIRLQLEKDLSLPGLPKDKIMATLVSLMERTNIRVGNSVYEKLYGSFGLTTLKDKHVAISGSKMKFCFVGKKGVPHSITLKNKKLASIVQRSKDIPGKELFQYVDANGQKHSVDSGMVNEYIKNACGEEFTAKDFRTWAGTVNAFLAFKEIGLAETEIITRRKINEALDRVAERLGNTRTVCKKYYIHPVIISLYENRGIEKYFNHLDQIEVNDNIAELTPEEKIIMKILEQQ